MRPDRQTALRRFTAITSGGFAAWVLTAVIYDGYLVFLVWLAGIAASIGYALHANLLKGWSR